MNMDPETWKNPFEFRPERFLDASETNIINAHKVLPFGAGMLKICEIRAVAQLNIHINLNQENMKQIDVYNSSTLNFLDHQRKIDISVPFQRISISILI